MENELPGEWGALLGPKGVHSYRDVAARVGISKGTAHRLMVGGATSGETVNKVADALFDGDRDLVWRLRGSARRDYGDWQLPAEASLLNPPQRAAVLSLIQVMVPAEQAPVIGSELADLARDPDVGEMMRDVGRRKAEAKREAARLRREVDNQPSETG